MAHINLVNNVPYEHAELSMITKILIFVLLLHLSNAGETHNNLTNFFELKKTFESNFKANRTNELARIFEKSCSDTGGLLLGKKRICIPQEDKFLIQYPPTIKL